MSEKIVLIDDSEFDEEKKFLDSLGGTVADFTFWDEALQKYTLPPQKFDPAKGVFVPTEK